MSTSPDMVTVTGDSCSLGSFSGPCFTPEVMSLTGTFNYSLE